MEFVKLSSVINDPIVLTITSKDFPINKAFMLSKSSSIEEFLKNRVDIKNITSIHQIFNIPSDKKFYVEDTIFLFDSPFIGYNVYFRYKDFNEQFYTRIILVREKNEALAVGYILDFFKDNEFISHIQKIDDTIYYFK